MCTTAETIRRKVGELLGERGIRSLASELGLSRSTVHRFLTGERGIAVDPVYQALYRRCPELRDLLDAHQREQALAGGTAVGQRRG